MKLLIFGGGDLTQRVVPLLARAAALTQIVVCTRESARGERLVRLFAGCLPMRIRHAEADYTHPNAMAALLRAERPDLIFHAAAMLSPWLLPTRRTPEALALASAGFGLMLPAQLPLIRSVMRAVGDAGLSCFVVNASYPDATHPVLAAEGLAPVIGVGNAGMLFNLVDAALREAGSDGPTRLFAHHAQITPFARGGTYAPGKAPWLHRPEGAVPLHAVVLGPLPSGRLLNALTARHAVQVIAALLGETGSCATSAPGPLGLPGGWPVCVTTAGVALDLPPGVTVERGCDYQARAARADGIAAIHPDGVVEYTEAARQSVAAVAPGLAAPLRPDGIDARLRLLLEVVR